MIGRFAIPLHSDRGILHDAITKLIQDAKVILRQRVTLVRSFPIPLGRLCGILSHAPALLIHHGQSVLGLCHASVRSFAVRPHRFCKVFGHAVSILIHQTAVVGLFQHLGIRLGHQPNGSRYRHHCAQDAPSQQRELALPPALLTVGRIWRPGQLVPLSSLVINIQSRLAGRLISVPGRGGL